jgi:hypothetical protein
VLTKFIYGTELRSVWHIDRKFGAKTALFIKTHTSKLAIIIKRARRCTIYSKFYLNRVFTEQTGITIYKYLQNRRLTIAAEKKWILGMDLMLAVVYAGMGFWVGRHTFHFLLYLLFTLTVGTVSVIYRLAYASWYPDLIPRGMEQKGYAASSTLYPTVIIVMSPIAAFLYENLTIDRIFFLVTGITLCSVMTESLIREAKKAAASSYTLRQSGHLQRYHPGERRAVLSAGTDAGQSQCLLQCTVRRGQGGLPVSGRRTWAVHPLSRCGGSAWRHGCRKRFPVHCSSCRRQPAGI